MLPAALAHYTADPGPWIELINNLDGLVNEGVKAFVAGDTDTTTIKILTTLHQVYETMLQSSDDKFIVRQLNHRCLPQHAAFTHSSQLSHSPNSSSQAAGAGIQQCGRCCRYDKKERQRLKESFKQCLQDFHADVSLHVMSLVIRKRGLKKMDEANMLNQ